MKIKRPIIWQACSLLLLIPLITIGFFSESTDSQPQTASQRSPASGSIAPLSGATTANSTVGTIVTPTLSLPVSSLPQISADLLPELVREINPRISHSLTDQLNQSTNSDKPDVQPAVDTTAPNVPEPSTASIAATDVITTPILNFPGGPFTQVHPSDAVGAIGKNYYIQMLNGLSGAEFRIYDRSGTLVQGPIALESLSSGDCAAGAGDPIVLYDQLAERWFMSEFHSQGGAKVLCHYISQTGDPTGNWFAYEFEMPNFPDYPKYGLWPSAYVGTANEVGNVGGPTPAIYAFDRNAMLNGEPAGYIRFVPPSLAGFGFQAFTPADLDGQLTPADGSPALYLRHRDDEVHNTNNNSGADFIEIWSLTPDFEVPENASFTQIANIAVSEFDSTMCGVASFECVPQQGSFRLLDPVREVLMHRVQYMHHGTHQSIVGNLVTDTTGGAQHGIFWFELRNSGNGWVLHQDGVLAPDNQHRWMGSIAMDTAQNIGLLYNVSGSNTFPSLRFTGRTFAMPLGTLSNQEVSIAEGAGANSSSRYGDYNSLTLDPLDECTFWATGQYNDSTTWSTQIATFKFPNCKKSSSFSLQLPSKPAESLIGTSAKITVSITAPDTFTETVTFSHMGATTGFISDITPISVVPTITPTEIVVTVSDATLLGTNHLLLVATSPSQTLSLIVEFKIVPEQLDQTTLIRPSNGASYVATQPELEWTRVAYASAYEVELATNAQFMTGTQKYGGIEEVTFAPPTVLPNDQTIYWRVRPVTAFVVGPWASGVFRTEPTIGFCQTGTNPATIHRAGFDSGLDGWINSGSNSSWAISTERVSTGTAAVAATAHPFVSTQRLTSPPLTLAPVADQRWLAFDIWRDVESSSSSCHDALVLEIEQDGIWQIVDAKNMRSDPYDFDITLGASNVLEGNPGWCGEKDWTTSLVDVSEYSGDLRLRFHLATDTSVGREGVYIDDVHLYECNPRNHMKYFPFFFKTD